MSSGQSALEIDLQAFVVNRFSAKLTNHYIVQESGDFSMEPGLNQGKIVDRLCFPLHPSQGTEADILKSGPGDSS